MGKTVKNKKSRQIYAKVFQSEAFGRFRALAVKQTPDSDLEYWVIFKDIAHLMAIKDIYNALHSRVEPSDIQKFYAVDTCGKWQKMLAVNMNGLRELRSFYQGGFNYFCRCFGAIYQEELREYAELVENEPSDARMIQTLTQAVTSERDKNRFLTRQLERMENELERIKPKAELLAAVSQLFTEVV